MHIYFTKKGFPKEPHETHKPNIMIYVCVTVAAR